MNLSIHSRLLPLTASPCEVFQFLVHPSLLLVQNITCVTTIISDPSSNVGVKNAPQYKDSIRQKSK